MNQIDDVLKTSRNTFNSEIPFVPAQIFIGRQKNDIKNSYEVSVLVCTYNASFDALVFTLESIINQTGILFEIVIADDGSKNSLYTEVIQYFTDKKFEHWTMVCNEENQGTVYNIYTGLKESSGEYVKTISPGDALHGENTLREWRDYNRNNNYRWSFADAIYYIGCPNEKNYIEVQAHPNNIKPYLMKKGIECRWNYLVLDDIAMGATLLCERSLMIDYVQLIVGKIIYAEDNIWRMMMFDGIVGGYFSKEAILYEYGTGISTSGSNYWSERLKRDWKAANSLMLKDKKLDKFQASVVKAWEVNQGNNKVLKIFIKGKLKAYCANKVRIRKTTTRSS